MKGVEPPGGWQLPASHPPREAGQDRDVLAEMGDVMHQKLDALSYAKLRISC